MKVGDQQISIIVIDDDEDDRMLVEDAIEEAGLPVSVTCVDTLERLQQHLAAWTGAPLLVLVDLNMPRHDGFSVLKHIRSNPVYGSIPVIVLTTSKADVDVIRAYRLGATAYIAKPLKYGALVALMSRLGLFFMHVEFPRLEQEGGMS